MLDGTASSDCFSARICSCALARICSYMSARMCSCSSALLTNIKNDHNFPRSYRHFHVSSLYACLPLRTPFRETVKPSLACTRASNRSGHFKHHRPLLPHVLASSTRPCKLTCVVKPARPLSDGPSRSPHSAGSMTTVQPARLQLPTRPRPHLRSRAHAAPSYLPS